MTRVQRERFFNEEDYLRLKDRYILTADKMKNGTGIDDCHASAAKSKRNLGSGG